MDVDFLLSNQWERSTSDPNRIVGPAPTVVSINRLLANPSSAANVTWQVKFSQSVANVGTSDFALVQSGGVTGASLTSATTTDNITFTVTANSGSNDGSLGLNLVDDDSITNVNNTPLGGAGAGNGNFTGQVYTMTRSIVTGWNCIFGVSAPKPSNLSVSHKALTSNVATLTYTGTAPAGLAAGRAITVAGVDATFNGDYSISAINTTAKTISYAKSHADVAGAAATGTIQYFSHEADNYIAINPGSNADLAMFNYMNTEYGGFVGKSTVFKLRHVYNGSTIPASYAAGAHGTPAGVHCLMATKGTDATMMDNTKNSSYINNIKGICADAPTDTITYLTWNHEPERAGAATAPNWRAAFARFAKAIVDNRGSKRIYPVGCLQQYTWQSVSKRDPSIWNPAAELVAQGVSLDDVVMGCDTYASDPSQGQPSGKPLADSQHFRDRVSKPFADFRSWGFQRICVPECGAFNLDEPLPSATATWLHDMATSSQESQVEFIAYFDSNVGASVGIDGWLLYADALKTIYAKMCDTNGVSS